MCITCGCDQPEHTHAVESTHVHIEADLMAENATYANDNREFFTKNYLAVFNIVASPGAGKTMLLEATAKTLKNAMPLTVIVGDQATENDAKRLKQHGVNALQIFTNKICHLDAHMISHAIEELDLSVSPFLFIENVGNLICPALFDLGEHYRIVLLSVTEGEDKPLKYPYMFGSADLVVLTKIDLLPYLNFNLEQCLENIKTVNPKADILQLSATNSVGFSTWLNWLNSKKINSYATA